MSYAQIEGEILNLARRWIITCVSEGCLRWSVFAERAWGKLQALQAQVCQLLIETNRRSRGALADGRPTFVDLAMYGPAASRLAHFLFMLSQEDARSLRVFEYFRRALRST